VLPSRFYRDRFRAALGHRQTLDGEDVAATGATLKGGPTKCSPKGERYKCPAKGGRYAYLAAALDGETEPKRFG
jgi:hypothetical protein